VASISNAVLSVVRRYRFSEEVFRVVESAGCAPLLGRYDRIIEYDRQRPAYAELSPSVLEKGHVTGCLRLIGSASTSSMSSRHVTPARLVEDRCQAVGSSLSGSYLWLIEISVWKE